MDTDFGLKGKTTFGGTSNKTAEGSIKVMDSGQINAASTVAQQPYLMGYLAVEAAVKTINGETVSPVVDVPANLITKESLKDFLKE
ncbi:type 1 periplasmic-binding domain-containing protein [Sediminispirochaeta bajacaliforniensis]|uniref:hypothetical protein n=1 Tax=Sediminispirochaeta bajacaliforniensis TaxID=148 RepID=UPI0012B5DF51|nr:hypothetical protein [Sediminispirochaeta bajacaliforniensis]